MTDNSDTDEELFNPRQGLSKKPICNQNLDESVAPPSSCVSEKFHQRKSRLSLSQKQRQLSGFSQKEQNKLSTPNNQKRVCENENWRESSPLDSSPTLPLKRSRLEDYSNSSSDDSIPATQNVPKKIIRRSEIKTSNVGGNVLYTPPPSTTACDPPLLCRKGKTCQLLNSPAHQKAFLHIESENSSEATESSVFSLSLPPDPAAANTNSFSLRISDSSELQPKITERPAQKKKISLSGVSSKEDFVQQWVDSFEIEKHTAIPSDEDTVPLFPLAETESDDTHSTEIPDTDKTVPLWLVAPSGNHLFDDIPEPVLTELQTEPEREATASTNNPRVLQSEKSLDLLLMDDQPVVLREMVTPQKVKRTTECKPTTSSGKQTNITHFFTPSTTGKSTSTFSMSSLKKNTHINTLNDTPTKREESKPETAVPEFCLEDEDVLEEEEVAVKQANAKEQWSYIMSRMNMRGTASNLQREIKNLQKPKPSKESAKPKKFQPQQPQAKAEEQPQVERKCPFYKRIPRTGFAIDAFCYGKVQGVTSYFLSHFHYDHYRGLGKWLDKPLYCSQVTANLVNMKIKPNPNLIRVLPLNESRLIENVEVILIDANHCPGSVMFLFKFLDGTAILHVGDFRAHRSMETIRVLKERPISSLYLDTTYCDEHYELPAQEDVLSYVRRLVRNYSKRHPQLLVVSGTYTIGKEKVFMAAAEELDSKVWAPTEKRRVLNCLDDLAISDRMAKNPFEARVHVVNMGDIRPANLKKYLDSLNGTFTHILALNPTGWEYDSQTAIKGLDSIAPKTYHGTIFIHGVPYSEHSGFSEMKRFVRHFRPARIIPTVNVGSAAQRRRMEAIFTEWMGRPMSL